MEEGGDSSPPTINISTEAPESQRRFIEHQESIGNPVLWWLEVPYAMLRSWLGADSFIKKLNAAMPDILLPVKANNPRIEESLRVKVTMVAREYKIKQRAGGRTAKKFDEKIFKMSVVSSEVTRLVDLRANNEALVSEWRKRYEDLEEEKEQLYHEMMEEVRESKQKTEKAQKENVHLHQRVKEYVTEKGLSCRGSKIAEIKTKSGKEKKIKSVRKRAQQALHFLNLFGLTLETLKVKDENGTNYNLGSSSQSNNNDGNSNSGYHGLSESDKGKVEQILFLLDKFGVGDEFYHEVTMTKQGEELPRSYLVKQLRSSLNTSCHISRTPGPAYGAQYSFEDFLVSRVACQLENKELPSKLKVKISGDGAKMTRLSNFMLLSFSFLQTEKNVLSSKGNHTFAVVRGAENYDTLKCSFRDVFRQINEVIDKGYITVEGCKIPVEIFLGGDYKFLLLMMGMSNATSLYSCIYCKIHKSERYDMSKDGELYNSESMTRSLEEMISFGRTSHKYCCANVPLLKIPPDHIVPDELHLLLRIVDRLLRNIIYEVTEWDSEDAVVTGTSTRHLTRLVEAINSCGVTFSVWQKENADGKASGIYDWTSLMGHEIKLLLARLPDKLTDVLHPETSSTVRQIWKDFEELYNKYLSSWEPLQIDIFHQKAKEWINLYLSLSNKLLGYANKDITPYMHIMVFHVPHIIKRYGNLKQFSGQGVEKNNDDARRVVLTKSNNWDSPADVLRSEHRQWELQEKERKPRQYRKKDTSYWSEGIKDARKKRKRVSHDAREDSQEPAKDLDNLSVKELKEELEKFGIPTSHFARKRKPGLLKMLKEVINSQ